MCWMSWSQQQQHRFNVSVSHSLLCLPASACSYRNISYSRNKDDNQTGKGLYGFRVGWYEPCKFILFVWRRKCCVIRPSQQCEVFAQCRITCRVNIFPGQHTSFPPLTGQNTKGGHHTTPHHTTPHHTTPHHTIRLGPELNWFEPELT